MKIFNKSARFENKNRLSLSALESGKVLVVAGAAYAILCNDNIDINTQTEEQIKEHIVQQRAQNAYVADFYVVPEKTFSQIKMVKDAANFSYANRKVSLNLVRYVFGKCYSAEVDSNNRVLFCKDLMRQSNCGQDVRIVYKNGIYEVWDQQKWEDANAEIEKFIK